MKNKKNFISICVFCGSQHGNDENDRDLSQSLGKHLAQNKMELVYGAGSIGLMGDLAQAALAEGGKVYGVIPKHLDHVEITQAGLTDLNICDDMQTRKHIMADRADAFIILSGGLGTLDEFFEVLTWAQLGLHEKPILVINHNGFWDQLLDLIDHIVKKGFANSNIKKLFTVVETLEAAIEWLAMQQSNNNKSTCN